MRVLLVEDHDATRAAVARVLRRHDLVVIEAASLGDVDPTGAFDIGLIDLRLGEESGLDLVRQLALRGIPSLVLTQSDDAQTLVRALKVGARGYLLKSDPPELIVTALFQATNGQVPLSAAITHHLLPTPDGTQNDYHLEVDRELGWAKLFSPLHTRTYRSETQVALIFALAEHWQAQPSGWLDNQKLSVAVWGRRHLSQHPNNLNVLMHRVRKAAERAGLTMPFLENQDGASRLSVQHVEFL